MNNWGVHMRKNKNHAYVCTVGGQHKIFRAGVCRVDFEEEERKERLKPVVFCDVENELESTVERTLSPGIEFVLQVMRLLALRWREHDIKEHISRERRKRKNNARRIKHKRRVRIKFKNVIVSPS